jgi:hypothetical protein
VSFLPMRKGTHQVTVHPSGKYVYNSAAVVVTGRPGSIEVYDITDPAEPRLTKELELLTGLDAHDMTFNADGTRVYVAALTHSFVVDTTDPADPVIIGRVYDPTVNIHHDAHQVTVDTPLGERELHAHRRRARGCGRERLLSRRRGARLRHHRRPRARAGQGGRVLHARRPPRGSRRRDRRGARLHRSRPPDPPEEQIIVMAWYNGGVRVLDYSGLADLGPAGVSTGAADTTLTPGIQEIGHFRFATPACGARRSPRSVTTARSTSTAATSCGTSTSSSSSPAANPPRTPEPGSRPQRCPAQRLPSSPAPSACSTAEVTPMRVLLVPLLVLTLLPTTAASADSVESSSDTMEFVTNLQIEEVREGASRHTVDMDFWSAALDGRPARGKGQAGPYNRDYAFVGTYLNGLQVVDISDPEDPRVVAVYDCAVAQADVFAFHRPDLGRVFVAYTSDVIPGQHNFDSQCHRDNGVEEGQFGTFIIDVTNPRNPRSVSFIEFPRGTHQVTVHPSGKWVYSSPAALTHAPGEIDIADITDPWNPVVAEPLSLLTGLDSHDILFNDDGTRAYSAALTHTLVIDTTEPGEPKVIGRIFDPAINIHHEAHPYTTVDALTGQEHTFLVISDELAGAAGNEVCPGGGLHVYDITGPLEQAPVKVGAWFIPEARPADGAGQGSAGLDRCSAHVLQFHPEHDILVAAWYARGTRVIDLSGLVGVAAGVTQETGTVGVGMREIGYGHFDDGDVWAAKTNRIAEDGSFYIFAADTARMLDVWRFTPGGETSAETAGAWLSPQEALAAKHGSTQTTTTACLLR